MKYITLCFVTLMVLFVSALTTSALRFSSLQANDIKISTTPMSTDIKYVRYTLDFPTEKISPSIFSYTLSFETTNLDIKTSNVEVSIAQSAMNGMSASSSLSKTNKISVTGKDGVFTLTDYAITFPDISDGYQVVSRRVIFDFDLTAFPNKSPHFTATLKGGDKTYTSGVTEAIVYTNIANGGSFSMGFDPEKLTIAPKITKIAKSISPASAKSMTLTSVSNGNNIKNNGDKSCTINDIKGPAVFSDSKITFTLADFGALEIPAGGDINIVCSGVKIELPKSSPKPALHWAATVTWGDDNQSISQDYTPAENRSQNEEDSGSVKKIVIAVIVIVVIGLIIAGGVWFFLKQRRKQTKTQGLLDDDEPYRQFQNE